MERKGGVKRPPDEDIRADEPTGFRPGSICRIKMKDFLTYDDCEVVPGARLNLVVGPNGTGKSSVVCAICLCLAGSTKSLGRAEQVKDYVKKGKNVGFIELELFKADSKSGKNVTVARKITLDNGSEFWIDGKKATQKKVEELTQRLNIHVDNKCAFLAQEMVVTFARMRPPELLKETELAINPKMHEQHEKLEKMGKETKKNLVELEMLQQNLETVNQRLSGLKERVARFEERKEFERKVEVLKKRRLWAEFETALGKAKTAEQARDEALKEKEQEEAKQAPLRAKVDQLKAEMQRWEAEHKAAMAKFGKLDEERKNLGDAVETQAGEVEALYSRVKDIQEEAAKREQTIRKYEKDVEKAKADFTKQPSNEELNQQLKANRTQTEELRKQKSEADDEHETIKDALTKEVNEPLRAKTNQLNEARNVKERRLRQVEKTANQPGLWNLWKWVQDCVARNEFEGPVFGPMFLEMDVKDQLAAKYVEHCLGAFKFGFVVTTKNDWIKLTDATNNQRDFARVQTVCVDGAISDSFPRLAADEREAKELKDLGIDGCLEEVVQCAPTVRQAFVDVNNANYVMFSRNPKLDVNKVLSWRSRTGNSVRSLFTPEAYTGVMFAQYGNKDRSDRVEKLQKPRAFLPGDKAEVSALEKEIADLEAKKDSYQKQLKLIEQKSSHLPHQLATLAKDREAIFDKQKARTSAERKVKLAEEKLADARKDDGSKDEKELEKVRKKIAATNKKRLENARKLQDVIKRWSDLSLTRDGLVLNKTEAKLAHDHAFTEFEKLASDLKQFEDKLKKAKEAAGALIREARKLKATAEANAPQEKWAEAFEEKWVPDTEEEIDSKILDFEAQAQANQLDDPRVIADFNASTKEAKELDMTLKTKQAAYDEWRREMETLKEEWLTSVKGIVATVNEQFKKYFSDMNCQGEVKLGIPPAPDQFEHYGIQIFVSYRHGIPMKLLTAEAQSGGEKSVATMTYLLCLQKVTDCPFRVVDEINQGMDPNNERIIFEQLSRSTVGASTPQYFLITPKLLPRLNYTENITVLFIHNGPWMCKQEEWTPEKFIAAGLKRKKAEAAAAKAEKDEPMDDE